MTLKLYLKVIQELSLFSPAHSDPLYKAYMRSIRHKRFLVQKQFVIIFHGSRNMQCYLFSKNVLDVTLYVATDCQLSIVFHYEGVKPAKNIAN